MLEIILLVFLSMKMSKMMKAKGRSGGGYVALLILLWIVCEVGGLFAGAGPAPPARRF